MMTNHDANLPSITKSFACYVSSCIQG